MRNIVDKSRLWIKGPCQINSRRKLRVHIRNLGSAKQSREDLRLGRVTRLIIDEDEVTMNVRYKLVPAWATQDGKRKYVNIGRNSK